MAQNEKLQEQSHPAFRFVVDVDGERQAAFTECILPTVEWNLQEVREGGLNTYTHSLPGYRKSARITFKNGVGKSNLFNWYRESLGGAPVRKALTVALLNAQMEPVVIWQVEGAYPVKWTGPQLKTDTNTIAIQTMELVCGEISVVEE